MRGVFSTRIMISSSRIYHCVCVVILCLHGVVSVYPPQPSSYRNGTFLKEGGDTLIEGSGGAAPFSDDEDLLMSGSGSGMASGMGVNTGDIIIDGGEDMLTPRRPVSLPTRPPVTREPTLCEKTKLIWPQTKCMEDGNYSPMQCKGEGRERDCYCVDLNGNEIPETYVNYEEEAFPDCEEGSNMGACTFEVVNYERRRGHLLGGYRPKCDANGSYKKKQCRDNYCFCVDEQTGKKVFGSEVNYPQISSDMCEDDIFGIDLGPDPVEETDGGTTVEDIDIDENPEEFKPQPDGGDGTDINIGGDEDDTEQAPPAEVDNETAGNKGDRMPEVRENSLEEASEIMTQPGILAGIIGGSVVVLLCLVLLVMFLIYRMRKKDEGSYPLDEPNRRTPTYSYVRAPQKEFYA